MGHREATKMSLCEARRKAQTLLSLHKVPGGHPVEKELERLFVRISSIVESLPAEQDEETDILIWPMPGVDPRDWPTSAEAVAREILKVPKSLKEKFYSGLVLEAPSSIVLPSVIRYSEYLEILHLSRFFDPIDTDILKN